MACEQLRPRLLKSFSKSPQTVNCVVGIWGHNSISEPSFSSSDHFPPEAPKRLLFPFPEDTCRVLLARMALLHLPQGRLSWTLDRPDSLGSHYLQLSLFMAHSLSCLISMPCIPISLTFQVPPFCGRSSSCSWPSTVQMTLQAHSHCYFLLSKAGNFNLY